MAFDAGNFNARASLRARASGVQFWKYDAGSDLLATVVADDFFLPKFRILRVGHIIEVITLGGTYMLKVTVSNALNVTTEMAASIQSLTGAGAVDTISFSTEVTSTGTDALTLIDGAIGQIKEIIVISDSGTATITPTNALGYTTIALQDLGDNVILKFFSGGWAVRSKGGIATGPVIA